MLSAIPRPSAGRHSHPTGVDLTFPHRTWERDKRGSVAGFTLLEVLLALALLAIVGMSVLTMSGESVRNTPILEQRTLARLVADNQMTELYLLKQWPTLSWQWKEHDLAGQLWFTRSRSIKTADDDFRAIDVEVRTLRDAKSPALATLRSYMVRQ